MCLSKSLFETKQNPKGYQNRWNGKFFCISENQAFWYLFVLVPVWVYLLQHPQGYQDEWGIKMASFMSFENLIGVPQNGGLRDRGLSKSEDIWGKSPFLRFLGVPGAVWVSTSGKRQKKAEKG